MADPVPTQVAHPPYKPSVIAIENRSFPNPWKMSAFIGEIANRGISYPFMIVHQITGKNLGYVIYWKLNEEAQISNFAVHPDYRGYGLGEAVLRQVLDDESGLPLSGIVVFSDGGQNAGLAPEVPVQMARKANVPIFTVGVGSDQQPTNVRVSDLVAPARAYPGDSYVVTGYVQAQGMAGQVVDVQLLSRPSADTSAGSQPGTGAVEVPGQVTLGGDGEVAPVKLILHVKGGELWKRMMP